MSFDGVDDYVYKSIANYQSTDTSGTISFWVKPTAYNTYNNVFGSNDEATTSYTFIVAYDSTGRPYVYQSSGDTADQIRAGNSLPLGTWSFVSLVSDGSLYHIYINGIPQTLTTVSGANTGDWFSDTANRDNITIGASKWSSLVNFVNGQIDDVRIFNYALTSTQVKDVYNGGSVRFGN